METEKRINIGDEVYLLNDATYRRPDLRPYYVVGINTQRERFNAKDGFIKFNKENLIFQIALAHDGDTADLYRWVYINASYDKLYPTMEDVIKTYKYLNQDMPITYDRKEYLEKCLKNVNEEIDELTDLKNKIEREIKQWKKHLILEKLDM